MTLEILCLDVDDPPCEVLLCMYISHILFVDMASVACATRSILVWATMYALSHGIPLWKPLAVPGIEPLVAQVGLDWLLQAYLEILCTLTA